MVKYATNAEKVDNEGYTYTKVGANIFLHSIGRSETNITGKLKG
jgi:hypothetical protein